MYWVTEGHCAVFGLDLVDECAVDDPGWVQPCDPAMHGCCNETFRICYPEYYQP